MNLSVLMTVYYRDNPIFFERAFLSITLSQTRHPEEVVLVIDGHVSDDLLNAINRTISYVRDNSNIFITVLQNPFNLGLAKSLNLGAEIASHELIARMDSDDIATRDRFETQLCFLLKNPNVDMLGSYYLLFDENPSEPYGTRQVPVNLPDKARSYYKRTPINHPTLIFKKSSFDKVGGYPDDIGRFEDWGFALKFIKAGFKIFNLDVPLLYFRAPKDVMVRRGGFSYAYEEFLAIWKMYRCDLLPLTYAFKAVLLRIPFRILPIYLRYILYKKKIWT